MNSFYLRNFEIESFLSLVRSKSGFNDVKIAQFLGVSKSLIVAYKKKTIPLSESNFLKLCSLAQLDVSSFSYERYIPRNHGTIPTLPSENNLKLAEFIGILLGDGHLSKQNYGIIITCGLIDFPYICGYVPDLIYDLFHKKVSYKISQSKGIGLQTLFYSKSVSFFLHTSFAVPIGKKQNPTIPDNFFKNTSLLSSCLRGLIDTDGGLYRHNKKSIQVCFYNSSRSLLDSVKIVFSILGFSPYFYWNEKRERGVVSISGQDALLYMAVVGTSNLKNKIKYDFFLKNGHVPLNRDITFELFRLLEKKTLKIEEVCTNSMRE